MKIVLGPMRHPSWSKRQTSDGTRIAVRAGIAAFTRNFLQVPPLTSTTAQDLASWLDALGGFFALVAHHDEALLLAVDKVRSIPLFFAIDGDRLLANDEPEWISENLRRSGRNEDAIREFAVTGFVTGADTVFDGVKQLQPGSFVFIAKGETPRFLPTEYYRFDPSYETKSVAAGFEELLHELDDRIGRAIDNLVEVADGRQLAIPLSGGYDSRIIATSLVARGYDNLVTYTYGGSGSAEVDASRAIATRLNIAWLGVDYTPNQWKSWFASESRGSYFEFAHLGVSTPHIQDWPAVWELRKRDAIASDAIFVPGHVAAGKRVPDARRGPSSTARIVREIAAAHYSLWPTDYLFTREELAARIISRTGDLSGVTTDHDVLNTLEIFNYRERQAKFIVNSVRAYEFWGYEWWMPLWDDPLLQFWPTVPRQLRDDLSLYRTYVARKFAQVSGGSLGEGYERDGSSRAVTAAKLLAKRMLPASIKHGLRGAARRVQSSRSAYHPFGWYGWVDGDLLRRVGDATEINSFVSLAFLQERGLLNGLAGAERFPSMMYAK